MTKGEIFLQAVWTIKHMFPNANKDNVEVTVYPDETWEITKWNSPDQKPTPDEIEAYWTAHEQEIMDANKPQPSDLDLMKKTLTDMSYILMMNGVL